MSPYFVQPVVRSLDPFLWHVCCFWVSENVVLFVLVCKFYYSFHDLKEVADALALEHGNKENALSSHSFRHLSDMLCQVTTDNDEDLELDEDSFIRLLNERHNDDGRDEYQRVFDLFDKKGKGHINITDLRKVAEELGEAMTQEELEEMISAAAPETGKVTPDDFQRIMTKRLFSS